MKKHVVKKTTSNGPSKKATKWQPAPALLIERFGEAATALPDVEMRKMFGYPCVFLKGNMFAGLSQDRLVLRLSPEDRADLGRMPGAKPFEPMPGRIMREYMVAPAAVVDSPKPFRAWMERAHSFAASLPPKPSRTSAKPRAATSKRKP